MAVAQPCPLHDLPASLKTEKEDKVGKRDRNKNILKAKWTRKQLYRHE